MMLHDPSDLEGLTVQLFNGCTATLESAAERAWLVHDALGRELYDYQLTAHDKYRLDDALADATYRADAAII